MIKLSLGSEIGIVIVLIGIAIGTIRWWKISHQPKDKVESKSLLSSKTDGGITVSKHALKDERLRSDFILGAIEDGVIMADHNNIIHLINPAAANISGWPAAEAVGLDFHSVINLVDEHGQPYLVDQHPFSIAIKESRAVHDSRGILVTRGGKHIPVSLIVSPIAESAESGGSDVIGVLRDITKEKADEARRTEFISTASHEMRTPIAAIEGYLALALNDKVAQIDTNARSLLEKAHNSTQQLGTLFQDLLTSSKAEDGRLASYPVVIEIGEMVAQIAEASRFNAYKKDLKLKYLLTNNEPNGGKVIQPLFYAYVDPNRMREVLQNIVDNAIKYTATGEITVALTGDASVVQIQVRDTGDGIAAEDLPHLFQKFYRVDNSMTRSVGGTGLGLFISKKIVELYNGRIWVESTVGKGSIFFINLPRLTAEQALEIQRKQSNQLAPI